MLKNIGIGRQQNISINFNNIYKWILDFWDEKYRQYQYDWKYELNENTIKPVTYDPNTDFESMLPNFNYKGLRDMVVEQSLQIDRIKCPIYNIYDASIDYSGTARKIAEEQAKEDAMETKSLFTITKNIEEGEVTDGT